MATQGHEFTFEWPFSGNHVVVTGTFDQWSSSLPLSREGGVFRATTTLPWAEKILYKFVVDGNWVTSPQAPTENDNSGNVNNVYTSPSEPAPPPPPAPEPVPVPEEAVSQVEDTPAAPVVESVSETQPEPEVLAPVPQAAAPAPDAPRLSLGLVPVNAAENNHGLTSATPHPETPSTHAPSPATVTPAAEATPAPAPSVPAPSPPATESEKPADPPAAPTTNGTNGTTSVEKAASLKTGASTPPRASTTSSTLTTPTKARFPSTSDSPKSSPVSTISSRKKRASIFGKISLKGMFSSDKKEKEKVKK
ncbi:carbohydrate-binding module family 48 protein [Cylindrobasidium torrendii FP15055 ss-10]|uniref:Carbohydrate-binding module family 48 protein n=1 Tax=Cylindrobasidium torrendii FP15055 ss-10 TaxID=1314674 RepID=A0A0D7BS22_9AGAR|nr:carbohydrate-binding module family 48 protein [Cylindrobasidium torrendii FP15055 ss-10]